MQIESIKSQIVEDPQKFDDWVPNEEYSFFSADILKRIDNLKVDADLEDEILEILKGIPPEKRCQYLNDVFSDNLTFESYY
jgi:hypothetical protein